MELLVVRAAMRAWHAHSPSPRTGTPLAPSMAYGAAPQAAAHRRAQRSPFVNTRGTGSARPLGVSPFAQQKGGAAKPPGGMFPQCACMVISQAPSLWPAPHIFWYALSARVRCTMASGVLNGARMSSSDIVMPFLTT